MSKVPFESPVGELEWVIIDGEGKADDNGNMKYTASVVVSEEVGEQVIQQAMDFWEENKPKNAKEPKSIGVYPHKVKDEEASQEAGENVYVETGKTVIVFKTGTTYQDGGQKIVKVFNAKGNEISLMGKKIGNGSRGRLTGTMAIYNINPKARGVTLYLDGVQLSKFVEYTGGVSFNAMEDEDGDGFDGVGDVGGIPEGDASGEKEPPKARI